MELYYDDKPLYKIITTNKQTKEKKTVYTTTNRKDARIRFKSMLSNIQSLKQWREIQNNPHKYTEIKLIKTYEFTTKEFPEIRGFIETKHLKNQSNQS